MQNLGGLLGAAPEEPRARSESWNRMNRDSGSSRPPRGLPDRDRARRVADLETSRRWCSSDSLLLEVPLDRAHQLDHSVRVSQIDVLKLPQLLAGEVGAVEKDGDDNPRGLAYSSWTSSAILISRLT